jgi:hypothetical protein
MCFFDWLNDKADTLKSFGEFISIIASCAAIILFVITLLQISNAADNLKANTIYSIAKDGRELSAQISEMIKKNDIKYGYIFNYMHSVWHQKRLDTLDDRLWTPIENEICLFLANHPKADSYWNDDTKKLFDPKFVEYIKKVGERPDCKSKKGG